MKNLNKILEIAYLLFAIVFFINAFTTFNSNRNKALLFGAFAVMALFMFFFKRKVRKKWYDSNKPKK